MEYFAGIDLGKEALNFHVVDERGKTLRHGRIAATPEAALAALSDFQLSKVGVEAGPYGQWMVEGLRRGGAPGVLIETRQMKAFASNRKVKTDTRDAEKIAQAMRCNLYLEVYLKSEAARHKRTLLGARRDLSGTRVRLQNSVRGLLKDYGVKLRSQSTPRFEKAVREELEKHPPAISTGLAPMLSCLAHVRLEQAKLDREVRRLARTDGVCRLLMSVPGVGPVVSLAFRATIDDPARFQDSARLGPYIGLTPSKYQSGKTNRDGRITKEGDHLLRAYLYEAATVLLTRVKAPCALQSWGQALLERRGRARATVAVARKLAIVMHRIWLSGKPFDWREAPQAAATAAASEPQVEAAV
jgi:transposase